MTSEAIAGWFAGRVPDGWFTAPPEVTADNDEILVVGALADVELEKKSAEGAWAAARSARVDRFRDETRQTRMRIADEAERRFDRKVSWGVEIAGERHLFTTLSVPVMTRLRMPERHVLDTLIAAGVARSRSDALAWCVRLVAKHEGDWIASLTDALVAVKRVRAEGPDLA